MNIFDVIVIGGGPCGITAAIYLKRLNRSVLLISEMLGGQVVYSGIIENYLGFNSISGYDLANNFFKQCEFNKIDYILNSIKKVIYDFNNKYFVIYTSNNKIFFSKSVLVASGSKYKKLNLPLEDEYFNKGIYNCSICDGYLFKNKDVIIIGGGNTSLDSALVLSKICNKVYVINKNNAFKGEHKLFTNVKKKSNVFFFYNCKTNKILVKNSNIIGIQCFNNIQKKNIIVNGSGIFVNIGMSTNISFLDFFIKKKLIKLNNYNEIIVDNYFNTNFKMLLAGGDVIEKDFKQAIISAGEGSLCALYLDKLLE